ncbi:MAG: alpha/beta fold hydrolase [Candidatus Lokiarchaeota archaeon]|nr:alpha/beta fold hydrolase [Candidatus Lokiarchaeota archaeon]
MKIIFMNRINLSKKQSILIISFLAIYITGTVLIFTVPFSVKSTYGLTTITDDGIRIAFNVFEPVTSEESNKKAVIIGHGFMANKEMMKGYAVELAAAGFVAIPFDFRGHGQSTGSLERGNLIEDVEAILDYLNDRPDIDTNNLAYIGYSMGGGPGNMIVNQSTAFKAFIGVGTSLGNIRRGTSTNPLNVLMIKANFDEVQDLDHLKASVAERTGLSTSLIDSNQMYGSFETGNATKIYLDDNSNHLAVAWDVDFTRQARDWIINTFPDTNTPDENFYGNLRLFILVIQVFGGIGLFIMLLNPISKLMKFNSRETEEKLQVEIREMSANKIAIESLLYSIPLGLLGVFIIIWIFLPIPLAITGFVLSLLFGQVFGILIQLWRLGKKNDKSLLSILKTPFKSSKLNIGKSIIYGFIIITLLYLILYSSLGLNYVGMIPSISKAWVVAIYFVITFLMFLVFGILFQFVIYSKILGTKNSTLKAILIHFGVLLAYIAFYLFLIGVFVGNFFYFGVMMPIAIPLNLLVAGISVYTYKKTGNIIAGTLISAILVVMVVCTFAPYQGFLGLLSSFLH